MAKLRKTIPIARANKILELSGSDDRYEGRGVPLIDFLINTDDVPFGRLVQEVCSRRYFREYELRALTCIVLSEPIWFTHCRKPRVVADIFETLSVVVMENYWTSALRDVAREMLRVHADSDPDFYFWDALDGPFFIVPIAHALDRARDQGGMKLEDRLYCRGLIVRSIAIILRMRESQQK